MFFVLSAILILKKKKWMLNEYEMEKELALK